MARKARGAKAVRASKFKPGKAPFTHDKTIGTHPTNKIGGAFKKRTNARFGVRGGKIGPGQAGTGHAEK